MILTVLLLEAGLRVYNPVRSTVSGNKIKLEKNIIRTIRNTILPCFEKVIFHRVNSIGFRGEDPPEDFNSYFRIISVGGSTTHSFYNEEGTTWTDFLGEALKNNYNSKIWINNAGLDGHSTFGHIMLIDDYISRLKPDMVIFLIGVNDIGRLRMEDGVGEQSGISKIKLSERKMPVRDLLNNAAIYSDLVSTLLNLYRLQKAAEISEGQWNVGHRMIDVTKIKTIKDVDPNDRSMLPYLGDNYLHAYAQRLKKLISISRKYNITPVFLSSPALFGDAIDPTTGVDLGRIITEDLFELSGSDTWKLLDGYNRIVEKVCHEENVAFIDLAHKMPKDSKYFYDWLHFTTDGSKKVAEIVYHGLVSQLPDDMKIRATKKENFFTTVTTENDAIRKMWEMTPDNPDLCFKMGIIHEKEGNFEQAVAMFQKALSSKYLYIQSLTRLAQIFNRQGEYDKSIAAYMKIVEKKPEIASVYYNISCLYSKTNQTMQSLQWLKMSIDKGYDKWDLIMNDKDLENIRQTKEFQDIIRMNKNPLPSF